MKIKVSHHIFASLKGYQTQFRSDNVTDSESAELESFSFGQTNDSGYISSLHNHPAYLIRKLKSGRWAITKVFEGADDEYGRITFLFHSILIDRDGWINQLDCDIQPLLDHPTLWRDEEKSEISVAIDPSSVPDEIKMEVNAIISKLMSTDQSLILDESLCSLQTIRWVNRLLPDKLKEKFTCGYRVLSDSFQASLLCLSKHALRGRSATVAPYNNSVTRRAPLYTERSDWHDGHRETNKTAIIIICVASVLGILGIIFISLRIWDLQYKKMVGQIITEATSFLNENHNISGDLSTREQKEKDATILIEQIQKITSKKPNAELGKTMSLLKKWKVDAKSEGQKYGEVNNLLKQIEPILDKEITIYPNQTEISIVLSIKEKLKSYLSELELNDLLLKKTDDSLKKIKVWLTGHEKYLIEIKNKINDIRTKLSQNDPNQYAIMDPNQISSADPNQFLIKADQNIQWLNKLKRDIQGVQNEPSLANAKNSPISNDREKAEEILETTKNLEKLTNDYIDRFNTLKYFATDIRRFEDDLSKGENETKVFIDALNNYDTKAKNATDEIQKRLLLHFKPKILDYYKRRIIGKNKLAVPGKDNDSIRDAIEKSTLSKEEVFSAIVGETKRPEISKEEEK